jgi:hypothetical protein
MTKTPTSFDVWLRYHTDALHVHKFYVRVEDTPELEPLLTSPPWSELVEATFHTDTVRDWSGQTSRQFDHVCSAISKARRDGLTHLLHIDDDELVFCPGGLRALQRELSRAPSRGTYNLHALTLEALVPRSTGALAESEEQPGAPCHFATCRAFRHRRVTFSAYGGSPVSAGKSFGVLGFAPLQPASPHHFCGERFYSAPSGYARGTHVLPGHTCVILHFESCSYPRWRRKFTEYARRHLQVDEEKEAAKEKAAEEEELWGRAKKDRRAQPQGLMAKPTYMPPAFFFYEASMRACLRRLEAERQLGECPTSLVCRQRVTEEEERCRSLWEAHRLEPAGLPACAPVFDRDQPQIILGGGHGPLTLIPPMVDSSTGAIRLPPRHLEGITSVARRPAPEVHGTSAAGPMATGETSWHQLVRRAGLPLQVAPILAQAAGDAARAVGETPASDPFQSLQDPHRQAQFDPALATRDELDALARRAGLPMGQRLKLRNLANTSITKHDPT